MGACLLWQFIQNYGLNILKQSHDTKYVAVKFFILSMSLVLELQRIREKAIEYSNKARRDVGIGLLEEGDGLGLAEGISEKLVNKFVLIMV